MITVTRIAGTASEPAIAGLLHDLGHKGQVEILRVDRLDTPRRRLRGRTDRGTDVAVALGRGEQLCDGAVLSLESDRAIVVRMTEERWLRIAARDLDSALETGYLAGNLHWRVRFQPGAMLVALEGPAENYIDRLAHLTMQGKIRLAVDD